MLVKEFKITAGGKCPVCRINLTLKLARHDRCVEMLDDMLRRGEAELVNWTDPLPAPFHALRPAIAVMLERTDIFLDGPGYRGGRREDETVY